MCDASAVATEKNKITKCIAKKTHRASTIGHAPIAALIDPKAGSRNAITEALTNMIWAPLKDNLKSVSLSANWMWPCKNEGEDARLYEAVEAISKFSIELGINVPTGKDSLSMKQKYPKEEVISPGTVIISAAGNCTQIKKVIEPVFKLNGGDIYYINISQDSFKLGGSSFNQILNTIGNETPDVKNVAFVKNTFNTIQNLIKEDRIYSGHDVASGGLITTLLEMCFADNNIGANIDLSSLFENDSIKLLFSENAGIVFQGDASIEKTLQENTIEFFKIGQVEKKGTVTIKNNDDLFNFDVSSVRDTWFKTSYLLDKKQTSNGLAEHRFKNFKKQPLQFKFPSNFSGKLPKINTNQPRPKAAIIREKGSNSEREMANAMYLAGFDVKDVHMTDLISGRETLEDIQFIGAVGGFSNSDVLGSAKGWAGAFLYNEKAKKALKSFFDREDTLSVGTPSSSYVTSNRFAFHDEMREIELVRLVVRLCMCVCVCVCATWTADLLTQHAAQAKRQDAVEVERELDIGTKIPTQGKWCYRNCFILATGVIQVGWR